MKKRKYKISNKRLSKIITNKECKSAQDYLIDEVIHPMSKLQRQDIRDMLYRNKNEKNN